MADAGEKDIWKQLARLNNMNLSAYTHFVIKEVIKESLNLPELKVSLDVDRESCEEDKFPIKLRMTKSELEAIGKLAAVRGQTRQALIASPSENCCWINPKLIRNSISLYPIQLFH